MAHTQAPYFISRCRAIEAMHPMNIKRKKCAKFNKRSHFKSIFCSMHTTIPIHVQNKRYKVKSHSVLHPDFNGWNFEMQRDEKKIMYGSLVGRACLCMCDVRACIRCLFFLSLSHFLSSLK